MTRMSRRRRVVAAALVGAALVSAITGCGGRNDDRDRLLEVIDTTAPLSRRFVYRAGDGTRQAVVRGVLRDDHLYKLQLTLDGAPVAEQVVHDDAVAVRFFRPDVIDAFVEDDAAGATVLDALRARRWVVDASGAPSLNVASDDEGTDLAGDPLLDARTVLTYVRRVVTAGAFRRYDRESLAPTYRRGEDPFPVPDEGSGVERFDSVLLPLPPPAAATQGARPRLPSVRNFRKMAVYVKGDRVLAVREEIGASPRQLDELAGYVDTVVAVTAPASVTAAFRVQVDRLQSDADELGHFLLGAINTYVLNTGGEEIRFRRMSVELDELGAVTATVELPADGVVRGSLAVLRHLGRRTAASS